MMCDWGDKMALSPDGTAPFVAIASPPDPSITTSRVYNVSYAYAAAGIYTVNCTMFNKVSSQTLTQNVSVKIH
jgi:PKD repeat protein